ncbi:MAG: hypothetical protein Q9213_000362 [Squamulea squamosa]
MPHSCFSRALASPPKTLTLSIIELELVVLVIEYQSGSSSSATKRLTDTPWHGSHNGLQVLQTNELPPESPNVGTAHPILTWVASPKKRRIDSGYNEGTLDSGRPSSSIPDVVLIEENHNGNEDPDTWSTSNTNILLSEQHNPFRNIHDYNLLEQELAKLKFLARWEELAKRGTGSRIALEKLCRFSNLPTHQKLKQRLQPYTELDKIMTSLCDFGSSQVQTDLVLTLHSLTASGCAILPSFSKPPPLDDLETALRGPLQQYWRASLITEFWAQSKERNVVLWRLCVLKEAGHLQQMIEVSTLEDQTTMNGQTEVTKRALTKCKIKEKIFQMHATMCSDPQ